MAGAPAEAFASRWELRTSEGLDAVCFLNALSGDPYYLEYYRAEYERFQARLSPEAKRAAGAIKRALKDKGKTIPSAFLALHYGAGKHDTLADILEATHQPGLLRSALQQTPYYNKDGWERFEAVQKDVRTVLQALKEAGFEQFWRDEIQPKEEEAIGTLGKELESYEVLPLVQQYLGRKLPGESIAIYMLYFAKPHGIRISGLRFLTNVGWSNKIVIRNAVHEMMHPPFDDRKSAVSAAIAELRRDPILRKAFDEHDPAFGYNTFPGYVNEDSVKALDQLIAERMGIAEDPVRRFRESDRGMHVLAAVLYEALKADGFPERSESYEHTFVELVRSGKLSPARVEAVFRKYFGENAGNSPR